MLSLGNFNFRPETLARYYADVTLADGVCQETCHFFLGNGVGEHANGRVVTPCKGIKDSLGFWIPRPGFRIPGTGFRSLLVKFGFWIPIFSRIPDSLSCIPDTKAQDSRFHKKIFPGVRNPDFLDMEREEEAPAVTPYFCLFLRSLAVRRISLATSAFGD